MRQHILWWNWDGKWEYQIVNKNDSGIQAEFNIDKPDISKIIDKASKWIMEIQTE